MGNFLRNAVLVIVVLIVVVMLAGFLANRAGSAAGLGPLNSAHWHTDFLVVLDGQDINFNQPKYMVRSPFVHVENDDNVGATGKVIHAHATGVTLGLFFESLGMRFSKDCFKLDTGVQYCNEGSKKLRFYVNGQPNDQYEKYVFHDKDKLLISYGDYTDAEIQQQLSRIPDFAKLISSNTPMGSG